MAKKQMKRKAPSRKRPRPDGAQIALSVVEKAIGGKLVEKKPAKR